MALARGSEMYLMYEMEPIIRELATLRMALSYGPEAAVGKSIHRDISGIIFGLLNVLTAYRGQLTIGNGVNRATHRVIQNYAKELEDMIELVKNDNALNNYRRSNTWKILLKDLTKYISQLRNIFPIPTPLDERPSTGSSLNPFVISSVRNIIGTKIN